MGDTSKIQWTSVTWNPVTGIPAMTAPARKRAPAPEPVVPLDPRLLEVLAAEHARRAWWADVTALVVLCAVLGLAAWVS